MNGTQISTTLASIVSAIAGFLAGRGTFGFDQSTWITILTAIVTLGSTLWAAWSARKTALVTAVANLPEVTKVELDKAEPGATALQAATPSNVVAK